MTTAPVTPLPIVGPYRIGFGCGRACTVRDEGRVFEPREDPRAAVIELLQRALAEVMAGKRSVGGSVIAIEGVGRAAGLMASVSVELLI